MAVNEEFSLEGPAAVLLKSTLSAAVPLWILDLQKLPFARVMERASECGQHVAEHGDDLMFRSSKLANKRHGGSAAAFNRLAEGLACLAFCPGGVRFMGLHFEAKHPENT